MFVFLIIAAIIAIPISSIIPVIGTDVWYPQYIATVFCLFLAVAWRISRMSKALGCLYAYCAYSSIFLAHMNPLSMVYLTQFGLALLAAGEIANLKVMQRRKIWYAILTVLVLQCVLGVLQRFHLDPFFRMTLDHNLFDVCGFSGGRNQFGLSLAACAMAAWMLFPIFLPLAILAMIFCQTLITFIAFFCGSAFVVYYRYGKQKALWVLPVAVFLVLAFLFYAPKTRATYERLAIWNLSINQLNSGRALVKVDLQNTKIITCDPWSGFGLGSFFKISPLSQGDVIGKQFNYRYEHAHNDYVEAYFDLGRIGFAIVLWVLADLIFLFHSAVVKSKELIVSTGALVVYAVSALAIYTVHTSVSGFYLALFLGLFYANLKQPEAENV